MALTWRDVAAPNFAGALEGYRTFSSMLGNAFSGLERGIEQFDTSKTDRVNNELLLKALAVQDSDTLKGQMPDLISTIDPRRIKSSTIDYLGNRASALLSQEATKQSINTAQYTQGRKEATDTINDNLRGVVSDLVAAGQRGDRETVKSIYAMYPELSNMRVEDQMKLAGDVQGLVNKDINITGDLLQNEGKSISNKQAAFTYANDVEAKKYADAATPIVQQILEETGGAEDVANLLTSDPRYANIRKDPKLYQAVLNGVQGVRGNPFGNIGSGTAGNAPGIIAGAADGSFTFDAPQQEVASALNGKLSPVVIAGALGNFHVEGGYGGAQGDGGSAGGIAQWRGARRDNFVKIYGKDPTKATMAEQADFFYRELTNPADMKIAGITQEKANRILNAKTPEEAASLIDEHYERSTGQHRQRRVGASLSAFNYLNGQVGKFQTATADRSSQNLNTSVVANLAKNQQDLRPREEIVRDALANDPTFKGRVRFDWLNENVKRIEQETGSTAATALDILRRGGDPGNFLSRPFTAISDFFTGGKPLDNDKVKTDIDLLATRGINTLVNAQKDLATADATVEAARQTAAAAVAKAQQYRAAALNNPRLERQAQIYEDRAQAATAALEQALLVQSSRQTNLPIPTREPQPVGSRAGKVIAKFAGDKFPSDVGSTY